MINALWKKYQEIVLYGIFGAGATLINVASYFVLARCIGIYFLVANILAWVLAFSFAFVTNKVLVFRSKSWGREDTVREFIGFLSARLGTGVLDTILMWGFVSAMKWDDTVAKVVINIIVIILNYIASKFFIFKKKEEKNAD